jgi:hypothetical protein
MEFESMTIEATNALKDEWKRLFTELTELNQQLAECEPHQRDALERAIADKEEDLLDTPAPSLQALRAKLELHFGILIGLDQETEQRRLILEDLEGLIAEATELLGPEF